jgi:hypothetical protein
VVEAFSVMIMSLCAIPSSKIVFTHYFAYIGGENKGNICFTFAKWLLSCYC